jgi:protein-S-isoprenylcysteine O-methyltransferase Ste14
MESIQSHITMDKKLITRYVVREILGLVGMGVALFWSAGRIGWWPAWGALAVMSGWTVATAIIVFRFNPGLLAERLPRQNTKPWDKAIVSSMGLITLIRYIVAGLDQRHGWSGDFPLAVQIGALVLCILGYGLFVWATAANPFFSQLFRVQSERGHTVITGGPYRYLRHPAYAGAILYELAVPFLFASWWALIVSSVSTMVLILRTVLEDRALQAELAGYREYTAQVGYRLLPGIW